MSWNAICREYKSVITVGFLIVLLIIANSASAADLTSNTSNTSGNMIISDPSINLEKPNLLWEARASMPTPRSDLFRGRLTIGDKIYVAGGWNGSVLDTVEVYDVSMNRWTKASPLPSPGLNGAIQSVNGKLYIINVNNIDEVGDV